MTDNNPESFNIENHRGILVIEPVYREVNGFMHCYQEQFQYDLSGNLLSFATIEGERYRIQ